MKTRRVGMALAILVAAVVLTATPAFAHWPKEGCTPGFWKRHIDMWPDGLEPDTLLSAVGFEWENTFMGALKYHGGSGFEGAARNLMRTAAAAYINAAHPDVNYPVLTMFVVHRTNEALASGDRDTMLNLAFRFDVWNNLGCTFP